MPQDETPTTTLPLGERQRLAALIQEIGYREACERVCVTREVMARLVGGLGVRRATRICASAEIAKLPPATTTANAPDPTEASVRPSWLDAWAEKYLTGEQRTAFERALAKNAPNWVRR
jgi:hypothetical protein